MTTTKEAFLVWDTTRQDHGEAPELLGVFATVDDAIHYAKNAFETEDWAEAVIDYWIMGTESPLSQYTLASTQEA